MKFLLSVLVIHLIVEFVNSNRKNKIQRSEIEDKPGVLHPAEFSIR